MKPGRKPIDADNLPARVHVTLSSRDYNKADAVAERQGVTVPEVLRRGLARVLADEADEEE